MKVNFRMSFEYLPGYSSKDDQEHRIDIDNPFSFLHMTQPLWKALPIRLHSCRIEIHPNVLVVPGKRYRSYLNTKKRRMRVIVICQWLFVNSWVIYSRKKLW